MEINISIQFATICLYLLNNSKSKTLNKPYKEEHKEIFPEVGTFTGKTELAIKRGNKNQLCKPGVEELKPETPMEEESLKSNLLAITLVSSNLSFFCDES